LPLSQDELHCCGHAIEARISAEDPGRSFLPSSGASQCLREPQSGDDIRVDSGVRQGDDISPWYDPILAKLIVQGHDRTEAITHLRGALAGYQIAGVTVNIGFLRRLAADPAFHMATHTTRYVDARLTMLTEQQVLQDEVFALLALYRLLDIRRNRQNEAKSTADPYSPWSSGLCFRLNHPNHLEVVCGGKAHR